MASRRTNKIRGKDKRPGDDGQPATAAMRGTPDLSGTNDLAATRDLSRTGDLPGTNDLAATRDLPGTGDLPGTPDLGATPDLPGTPDLGAAPMVMRAKASVPVTAVVGDTTGDDLVALAQRHLGEPHVPGARAPMGNVDWRGPWDCAGFVSWCVHRASGIVYGAEPRNDPMMADAGTGFWARHAETHGQIVSVAEASAIAGAAVLRRPVQGQVGHLVLSDGRGGTIEAHSRVRGVVADTLSGRRWDIGILVPGIRYLRGEDPPPLAPPPPVLRLTSPLTRSDRIRRLQQALAGRGLATGSLDAIYGPQVAHAVRLFQSQQGLVADGEAGPATFAALGIAWD